MESCFCKLFNLNISKELFFTTVFAFSIFIFFSRNRIKTILSSIMHYLQLVKKREEIEILPRQYIFCGQPNLRNFSGMYFCDKAKIK